MEGDGGDPRVMLILATAESIVHGQARSRAEWRKLGEIMATRLASDPDQPRNRLLLFGALVGSNEPEAALVQWRLLKPYIADATGPGSPDYPLAPFWLVRIGQPAEASWAIAQLEARGTVLPSLEYPSLLVLEALGIEQDTLFDEYRNWSEETRRQFLALYGHP
jgi:hypothetical protein